MAMAALLRGRRSCFLLRPGKLSVGSSYSSGRGTGNSKRIDRHITSIMDKPGKRLFPFLTVHETLLYSVRLRIPAAVPWPDKLAKVEAVMAELGLSHVAHSIIGDPTDTVSRAWQISGGERRRTSIGVHSVHDPAILFLDEPTSGLDSGVTLQVVAMLQGAATGKSRTIVAPSPIAGHDGRWCKTRTR